MDACLHSHHLGTDTYTKATSQKATSALFLVSHLLGSQLQNHQLQQAMARGEDGGGDLPYGHGDPYKELWEVRHVQYNVRSICVYVGRCVAGSRRRPQHDPALVFRLMLCLVETASLAVFASIRLEMSETAGKNWTGRW